MTMIDREKAQVVNITVDDTGKLWVNVDGMCVVRIAECDVVTMDDPLRGLDTVWDLKP